MAPPVKYVESSDCVSSSSRLARNNPRYAGNMANPQGVDAGNHARSEGKSKRKQQREIAEPLRHELLYQRDHKSLVWPVEASSMFGWALQGKPEDACPLSGFRWDLPDTMSKAGSMQQRPATSTSNKISIQAPHSFVSDLEIRLSLA